MKTKLKKYTTMTLKLLLKFLLVIGVGTFVMLIYWYYSFVPCLNLEIKEVIKQNEFASNPIILINPNPYTIENVNANVIFDIGRMVLYPSKMVITNTKNGKKFKLGNLKPGQKKRITTDGFITLDEIYMLESTTITIKISYETPFYYKDVDSVKFTYDVEKNEFEKTVFIEKNIKY